MSGQVEAFKNKEITTWKQSELRKTLAEYASNQTLRRSSAFCD